MDIPYIAPNLLQSLGGFDGDFQKGESFVPIDSTIHFPNSLNF